MFPEILDFVIIIFSKNLNISEMKDLSKKKLPFLLTFKGLLKKQT